METAESLAGPGAVGWEVTSVLIRSRAGLDEFTCIMSFTAHRNPRGEEAFSRKHGEAQALRLNNVSTANK